MDLLSFIKLWFLFLLEFPDIQSRGVEDFQFYCFSRNFTYIFSNKPISDSLDASTLILIWFLRRVVQCISTFILIQLPCMREPVITSWARTIDVLDYRFLCTKTFAYTRRSSLSSTFAWFLQIKTNLGALSWKYLKNILQIKTMIKMLYELISYGP